VVDVDAGGPPRVDVIPAVMSSQFTKFDSTMKKSRSL